MSTDTVRTEGDGEMRCVWLVIERGRLRGERSVYVAEGVSGWLPGEFTSSVSARMSLRTYQLGRDCWRIEMDRPFPLPRSHLAIRADLCAATLLA